MKMLWKQSKNEVLATVGEITNSKNMVNWGGSELGTRGLAEPKAAGLT